MPEREMEGWAAGVDSESISKPPKTNHQAPEKVQTSKFKNLKEPVEAFGAWKLVFLWSLEFGV
jgi:hypothetical protein